MVEETAADDRQLDPARRAGHSAASELGLEVAHLAAERRLRDMQARTSGSIVKISSTFGHDGGAGAPIHARG